MKRLLALLSSSALAGAMSVAPVLADTGGSTTSNTTGLQHDIDCLALLLTDPVKHASECGGPNFTPAPPPSSGGFGPVCRNAEIVPFAMPGPRLESDAQLLVADSPCGNPGPCLILNGGVPQQQLEPVFDTFWTSEKTWLVTATAC